ncbi:Hint domain-containing protein [Acetobacter indonesiensis]|uniref:Hint domain-containing protein n=1 Tax=Acetobacter indonesiensis TaxID=104101 RepID=UPI0039E9737C
MDGDYTGEHFVISSDGDGGTLATLEAHNGTPCYCVGTLITTDQGQIPVETLQVGDLVVTESRETRPIHWTSHRRHSGRFASRNPTVLPVIFTEGSLGNDLPRRDLWVSPLHAMFMDDGSCGMFHNAPEYVALYPDTQKKLALYCAPRVEEGVLLETVQNRLNQTAGKSRQV